MERENMAIIGIGVDLCEIERIERAAERPSFVSYVFSEEEIGYAQAHKRPAVHFASCFAAKEALAKAGGWGLAAMGVRSCSITRTKNGPKFIFSDQLKALLAEKNISHTHLTLTHDGSYAVAVVVLEA
jgi:holo-[acyl-carrier protein] synthase